MNRGVLQCPTITSFPHECRMGSECRLKVAPAGVAPAIRTATPFLMGRSRAIDRGGRLRYRLGMRSQTSVVPPRKRVGCLGAGHRSSKRMSSMSFNGASPVSGDSPKVSRGNRVSVYGWLILVQTNPCGPVVGGGVVTSTTSYGPRGFVGLGLTEWFRPAGGA
jgi:hypothetical protein